MIQKQHISKFKCLLQIFIKQIKFPNQQNSTNFSSKISDFLNKQIKQFINNYNPTTQQNKWLWQIYNLQDIHKQKDNSIGFLSQDINLDRLIDYMIEILKKNQNYIYEKIQQQKIRQGYKLLNINQTNRKQQTNKIQNKPTQQTQYQNKQLFYLFNHPVFCKQKQNFRIAKFSNETILTNQNKQINKQNFYNDFYQQQSKQNIILINPNILTFSHILNQNPTQDYSLSIQRLITQTPDLIIITKNDIFSILSLISYQIIFNDIQEKYFNNLNNYKKMKILATQTIYNKYLCVFSFLQILTKKIIELQNRTNFINEKFKQEIKLYTLQNRLHQQQRLIELFKYSFLLTNLNIPFQYLTLSLYFRSRNLYVYDSYDLQIEVSSNNLGQKLSCKCLIEGPYLKNIKQIYYSHKNNKLTQKQYIQIMKRIQFKYQQHKIQQNYIKKCLRIKNAQIYHQKNSILALLQQNSYVEMNILKDIIPNITKKINIINQFNIKSQKQNKQNVILYRNPYQISIKKKQLFYPQLRNIKMLQLLTDQEIVLILNNAVLIQYINNQIVFNSSSKLEDVYIIMRGKVLLFNKKEEYNAKRILKRNSLFGWEYFLNEFNLDQALPQQKNIIPSKSSFQNFSNITIKSYDFEDQNQPVQSQNDLNIKIISNKAIILKISFQFMDFWLYYKKNIIINYLTSQMK